MLISRRIYVSHYPFGSATGSRSGGSILMTYFQLLIFIVTAIQLAIPLSAHAADINCDNYRFERNKIIALFDGSIQNDIRETPIHNFLQLPLNFLGYNLVYQDITTLEGFILPNDTAAILSWFGTVTPFGDAATRWRLDAQTDCGYRPKQIVFGYDGMDYGENEARSELHARLGLKSQGWERAIGHRTRVSLANKDLVGYEDGYTTGIGAYPFVQAVAGTESFLGVEPQEGGDRIDLVTIGTGGAYAHQAATVNYDPRLDAHFWVLDPFALIERTLGSAPRPIADTTTMLGKRMFFSTVHPEGWLEPEPSRYFGEQVGIAGEILSEKLVAPYPNLPTTVAILLGDFVPELAGLMSERGKQAATSVLEQPWVSSATSGHDLVRNWERIETIGEQSPSPASPARAPDDPIVSGAVRALGELFAVNVHAAPLRKYSALEFSFDNEIAGALKSIAEIAPPNSATAMFLWSVNSRPSETALRAVREAGGVSIGGNRETAHPELPLLSSLAPQSAQVGAELQVYAALASDAAYTGHWTRDQTGLHLLRQTLEWTEKPRRLKPFHLNYSAKSALHFATMSAITQYLQLAGGGAYIPVSAKDYTAAVEGFETVSFERLGNRTWRVLDRGGLQTVRFDQAGDLALDMVESLGVLGAVRKSASLYVSLDPTAEAPVIALKDDDNATGISVKPGHMALATSDRYLADLQRSPCEMSFNLPGASKLMFVTSPGANLSANFDGELSTIEADENGLASLAVPVAGPVRVTLQPACGEG